MEPQTVIWNSCNLKASGYILQSAGARIDAPILQCCHRFPLICFFYYWLQHNVIQIRSKIGPQWLKHVFVMFGLFWWKICGKDVWKSEVALFCFLGHRANLNSMDWIPENLEFHNLGFCGTPGNPYLWIWIFQNFFTNLRTFQIICENMISSRFRKPNILKLSETAGTDKSRRPV